MLSLRDMFQGDIPPLLILFVVAYTTSFFFSTMLAIMWMPTVMFLHPPIQRSKSWAYSTCLTHSLPLPRSAQPRRDAKEFSLLSQKPCNPSYSLNPVLKGFDAEGMEIQLSFREVGAMCIFCNSVTSRREFAMTAEPTCWPCCKQ